MTDIEKILCYCKHWWFVYSPKMISFDDYVSECLLAFVEMGKKRADAIKLMKKNAKWVLFKMVDDYMKFKYPQYVFYKEQQSFWVFDINDVGLTSKQALFCQQLIDGFTYKEIGITKRDIIAIRKMVGDYFKISQKDRHHRNFKFSQQTCEERKARYQQNKDKLLADAIKKHQKPVYQIHNGERIKRFDSIKEAAIATGCDDSSICKSIHKHFKTGGYNWEYAN